MPQTKKSAPKKAVSSRKKAPVKKVAVKKAAVKKPANRTKKSVTKKLSLKRLIGIALVLAIIGTSTFMARAYFNDTYHTAYAASVIDGKSWVPIFTDNFDGTSLNTTRWNPYYNTFGDGNKEEACLTPNNVTVANGTLRITAKREAITCPGQPQDNFSSGFIGSREKGVYYPAFARYEIRAKLPHAQGLWPAFWLRHVAGSSTAEIDVMEYFHSQVPGKTSQTLHFPNEIGSNVAKKATGFETPTTSPGYHTWAVEIIPTNATGTTAKIRMFTDNVMVLEYTPTKFGWLNNYDKSKMFDIALNMAVGGTYTGHPDDALGYSRYTGKCLKPYNGTPPCDGSGILRASFPSTYEIDYVSVAELRDTTSTGTTTPPPPTTTTDPTTGTTTPPPTDGTTTTDPTTGTTTPPPPTTDPTAPGKSDKKKKHISGGSSVQTLQVADASGTTATADTTKTTEQIAAEKEAAKVKTVTYSAGAVLSGLIGTVGYVFRDAILHRLGR